jgi:hypothetical protein
MLPEEPQFARKATIAVSITGLPEISALRSQIKGRQLHGCSSHDAAKANHLSWENHLSLGKQTVPGLNQAEANTVK